MSMPLLILSVALGLSLLMALAWWLQRSTGQGGWVDTLWSFGIGAAAVVFALAPVEGGSTLVRSYLVAALAAIWSLRLGSHILRRTLGGTNDPRYERLLQDWGEDAQPRMFRFLQIQAAAAFTLALSVLVAARRPGDLGLADLIGALILVAAIAGEALADSQLRRFAANPANKGKVCDVGLWRWSRHPNYFFQWFGWLAYPVIAMDLSGNWPWGWLALTGPAFMYWILVHASGIPPLEAHMLRSRGEAFRAYQARTNAFFPGPPKSRSAQLRQHP